MSSTLLSPGVSISVTTQQTVAGVSAGTTPLIFVALNQNKLISGSTSIAPGTLPSSANTLFTIAGQNALLSAFGTPVFQTVEGTPVAGSEQNEYGLLAAYQFLGVSSNALMVVADIDLNALTPSVIPPTNPPVNGTYWFDVTDTTWGVFQSNGSAVPGSAWNVQSVIPVSSSSQTSYYVIASTRISDPNASLVTESSILVINGTSIPLLPGASLNDVVIDITDAAISNVSAYAQRLSQSSTLVVENLLSQTIDFTGSSDGILDDLGLVQADTVIMPKLSIGVSGSFAVVTTSVDNVLYQKITPEDFTGAPDSLANSIWLPVGSVNWMAATPTVVVGSTSPVSPIGAIMSVSDGTHSVSVTFSTTGGSGVGANAVTDINAAIAAATINAPSIIASTNGGAVRLTNTAGGTITVANVSGTAVVDLGLSNKTGTQLFYSPHTQIPNGSTPGDVWIKTTTPNSGSNWVVKLYNASTGTFSTITAPFFDNDDDATAALGVNVQAGTLYVQYNIYGTDETPIASEFIKVYGGNNPVTVQGTTLNPTVANGSSVVINGITVTFTNTDVFSAVNRINAAGITNVSASLVAVTPTSNRIQITNSSGLSLTIANGSGTPLTNLGLAAGQYSNWTNLNYTASVTSPTSSATAGQLWYNADFQVDIMVNAEGDEWRGYRNVFPNTNPTGVLLAGSAPTTHTDGGALVDNDLWIDTADTETFPQLYVYATLTSSWNAVDTSDHTTPFGVVFSDARWTADLSANGSQVIEDMLVSDNVDPDCIDPRLYPAGMLLFNTRYSSYNVKEWNPTAFASFVGQSLPGQPEVQYNIGIKTFPAGTITTANQGVWVTASGNDPVSGVMYAGRHAQRQMVIEALTATINSNQQIRGEGLFYNLLAAPGYPEVLGALKNLNVDKKQIAFVVGDTPARLSADSTSIANWATNTANVAITGDNGYAAGDGDNYQALYYPWGFTTNLDGTEVVVPPSHYALSTYGFNDSVAAPWFAPAGTDRGGVNVSSVGYINSQTGLFNPVQLSQGLRDTLYSNNINPVAYLPNRGLYVYGQKTILSNGAGDPQSRVAGSRLINYLRWWYDYIAQPFLFQPNDAQTWQAVRSVFNGFNSNLVTQQALQDFVVVCDASNNPQATQALYELNIAVAVLPVFSIEFIFIPITVVDTSDALSGSTPASTQSTG